jgi:hypothetical protein
MCRVCSPAHVGTIKLTSAQLKTMSGELKVKKELELEREKAKQKEKELDSSVRMLKTKEDEVKKLTKHNEQQEKVTQFISIHFFTIILNIYICCQLIHLLIK